VRTLKQLGWVMWTQLQVGASALAQVRQNDIITLSPRDVDDKTTKQNQSVSSSSSSSRGAM
jgi:hypothetical protein